MSAASVSPPRTEAEARTRAGLLAGLASYLLWGFLPLLFAALGNSGPVMVVAWRTIFSVLLVGLILHLGRRWSEVRVAFADRRAMFAMLASSLLLAVNWLIYVYGVTAHQTLEASFGYYINPMVNVAIGMLLLGERQNRVQTVAILIGLAALVLQAVGLGGLPLIAIGVAVSFAFYGYFRKTAKIGSATGLFIETLMLTPLAMATIVVWVGLGWGWGFATPGEFALVLLTGPATAVPLLLFAFSVQRLRLTTIGMLQYLGPTIQFVLAVFVLGETLNATRLASFALIWLSVAVYTADSLLRMRRAPTG